MIWLSLSDDQLYLQINPEFILSSVLFTTSPLHLLFSIFGLFARNRVT